MKSLKRRLLSLFLAMVMVLSLAPMALAVDDDSTVKWKEGQWTNAPSDLPADSQHKHEPADKATSETVPSCTAAGSRTYACKNKYTPATSDPTKAGEEKECTATRTDTADALGHDYTGNATAITDGDDAGKKHSINCTRCNAVKTEAHDYDSKTGICKATGCNAQKPPEVITVKSVSLNPSTASVDLGGSKDIAVTVTGSNDEPMANETVTITKKNSGPATADKTSVTTGSDGKATFKVTADSTKAETTTFEVKAGNKTETLTFKVNSPVTISSTPTSASINSMDDVVKLTANYSGSKSATYKWTFSGSEDYFSWSDVDKANITIYAEDVSSTTRTLTATVTVKDGDNTYTASKDVTLKIDTQISVSATVSDNYFLGDGDNKTNDSIWDKIEERVNKIDRDYDLEAVEFDTYTSKYGDLSGVTSKNNKFDEDELADIEFIPEEKGDAEFRFTAHVYDTQVRKDRELSGMLTITVTDTSSTSGGNISYTAEIGEDVYFDVSDFEDFWEDKYSSGTLDHVVFGSATNGKLKDARSTVSYNKDKYYVDPGKNDDDLADVYFVPSSSKKAMTAKISFTAYGSKTGSSGSSYDRAGTITIYYLNEIGRAHV